MVNMFGQIPGMQDTAKIAMDAAIARQEAKKRGVNRSGIASVTADNQVGGFAATTPATPGLGAGGFAVAPAVPAVPAAAAPELAAETISGDLGTMAAAAATPDPYNNAIRMSQQDAVGQIQGNAFMRQQSMLGLV
jgi:hypothetical protein